MKFIYFWIVVSLSFFLKFINTSRLDNSSYFTISLNYTSNNTNNQNFTDFSDHESYAEELYPLMIGLWFCFVIAMLLIWNAYYKENRFTLVSDTKSINNIKNESTPI
jgi:hypothetical protein